MRKIDTFNLRWLAKQIDRELSQLNETIIPKLYLLRVSLMNMLANSEALLTDLADLQTELQAPLWKRLLSK